MLDACEQLKSVTLKESNLNLTRVKICNTILVVDGDGFVSYLQ